MFTVEELISFNETMLQRGVPNTDDNVGYNKADYAVCSKYFKTLTDSQCADISKRLIKYTNTQLGVSREEMKETHLFFLSESKGLSKNLSISIEIKDKVTLLGFRYNEDFINAIRTLPANTKVWNDTHNSWTVKNEFLFVALERLEEVGADVSKALEYANKSDNELVMKNRKCGIIIVSNDKVLFKFPYDKRVLDIIKDLPKETRVWNHEYKYWSIDIEQFKRVGDAIRSIMLIKIQKEVG